MRDEERESVKCLNFNRAGAPWQRSILLLFVYVSYLVLPILNNNLILLGPIYLNQSTEHKRMS